MVQENITQTELKGELFLNNGRIIIPEKYGLSETKRTLRIVMPWHTEIQKLCKGNDRVTTTDYFRQKDKKPYVAEGYIEIDGDLFKVTEVTK